MYNNAIICNKSMGQLYKKRQKCGTNIFDKVYKIIYFN